MVYIDGVKYACERCIRGHRVTGCNHTNMPLTMIKPKGRPATQCSHCRESRRSKQLHTKCKCGSASKSHNASCPCYHDKDLCSCAKNKRTASNPPPASKLPLSSTSATNGSTVSTASVTNSPLSISIPSRSSSSSSLVSFNSIHHNKHRHHRKILTSKLPAQQQLTPVEKPDIPMLFPFGPSENVSTNGDLLHSLESSSSLSSLGNMEGGYSSDAAEPPIYFQKKYSQNIHDKPLKTGLAPRKEAGEIYVNNELSVLDDFTLLSPDDNYEVLSSSAGNGILEHVEEDHLNDIDLFQSDQKDQFFISKQRQMRQQRLDQDEDTTIAPLFPILTANRPPHKEVDFASHLYRSSSLSNRRGTPDESGLRVKDVYSSPFEYFNLEQSPGSQSTSPQQQSLSQILSESELQLPQQQPQRQPQQPQPQQPQSQQQRLSQQELVKQLQEQQQQLRQQLLELQQQQEQITQQQQQQEQLAQIQPDIFPRQQTPSIFGPNQYISMDP